MTLYEKLQQATSEEDVKDAHIKALGLKDYKKTCMIYKPKKFALKQKMVSSTALTKCAQVEERNVYDWQKET